MNNRKTKDRNHLTPSNQEDSIKKLLRNSDSKDNFDIESRPLPLLYLHHKTLDCIVQRACIPCIYKVYPFGLHNLPPNQRPEQCPRAHDSSHGIEMYTHARNILILGDGDFSFSASITQGLSTLNPSCSLLATSYESLETIHRIYPKAEEHINTITSLNQEVYHGVDASNLLNNEQIVKKSVKFDFIIWNFPCIAHEEGADGQVNEILANQTLLQGFFQSASTLLSKGGEIHLTHKTIEPFSWWKIHEVGAREGYVLRGGLIFDKYLYPGYVNRKALANKSFPCNDALVHVFTKQSDAEEHDRTASSSFSLTSTSEIVKLDENECLDKINDAINKLKHKSKK